jgi:hypothetical protein
VLRAARLQPLAYRDLDVWGVWLTTCAHYHSITREATGKTYGVLPRGLAFLVGCDWDAPTPLGHPWGTLATVRDLWASPLAQESRFYWDFESQESPRVVTDCQKTRSECAGQRFESVRRLQRNSHDSVVSSDTNDKGADNSDRQKQLRLEATTSTSKLVFFWDYFGDLMLDV